jgi:hypothetical protein
MDATEDGWVTFDEPLGVHDVDAISHALAALEKDGLVERGADLGGSASARLPRAALGATLPGP